MPNPLDFIPECLLDEEGLFKYILIKATIGGDVKFLVRGHARHDFHDDIFQAYRQTVSGDDRTKGKQTGSSVR